MSQSGYVRLGSGGCLLPLLIIFNLFFGRLIFDSAGLWLGVELVLILIFTLKIKFMFSKIIQQFNLNGSELFSTPSINPSRKTKGKIIDIQGQEIKEEKELE